MLRLDDTKPGAALLWSGPGEQDRGMTPRPEHAELGHRHPGARRRLRLRPRQRRSAALSRGCNRQAACGRPTALLKEHAMYGTAFFVRQQRPLLHQQRSRRARHRQAVAEGVRGDQPRQADRADPPVRRGAASCRTCCGRTPPTPTGTSSSATTRRSSGSRSRGTLAPIAQRGMATKARPHDQSAVPGILIAILVTMAALEAVEATLVQAPSPASRSIVALSDLHMGPGRVPSGCLASL